jgi:hypothetical protein
MLSCISITIKEISDITNIENIIINDNDSYIFISHHLLSFVKWGGNHTLLFRLPRFYFIIGRLSFQHKKGPLAPPKFIFYKKSSPKSQFTGQSAPVLSALNTLNVSSTDLPISLSWITEYLILPSGSIINSPLKAIPSSSNKTP